MSSVSEEEAPGKRPSDSQYLLAKPTYKDYPIPIQEFGLSLFLLASLTWLAGHWLISETLFEALIDIWQIGTSTGLWILGGLSSVAALGFFIPLFRRPFKALLAASFFLVMPPLLNLLFVFVFSFSFLSSLSAVCLGVIPGVVMAIILGLAWEEPDSTGALLEAVFGIGVMALGFLVLGFLIDVWPGTKWLVGLLGFTIVIVLAGAGAAAGASLGEELTFTRWDMAIKSHLALVLGLFSTILAYRAFFLLSSM